MASVRRGLGLMIGGLGLAGRLAAGEAAPAAPAVPQAEEGVTAPVCAAAPFLDGVLTDACWGAAAELAPWTPLKGGTNPLPHRAWLARDDAWLYVAAAVAHPHPAHIRETVFEADGPVQQDDSLELFVDPGSGGQLYLHYLLNAANIKADQVCAKPARRDRAYPMPWRSATRRTDSGWAAEIAIPLAALKRCRQLTTALDLAQARLNLTITTLIPTLDPYGAVMFTATRCDTWAPLAAGPHEPARFRPLRGLPAFADIRTTEPGRFLTPHLFLPRLAGVQVGAFDLAGGQPGYVLEATVTNASAVAGAVRVRVADRPLAGAATGAVASATLPGGQGQTIAVRVPMGAPGRRTAVVWLEDPERGGAFGSWVLDEQALVAMEPLAATPDRNYYTAEPAARMCCRVRLPPETLAGCRLAVVTPDGRTLGETRAVTRDTAIAIPLDRLPLGRSAARVDLLDGNGRCLARQDTLLVRHPPNPGCEIQVDRVNRVLLRNGAPFFCFGICSMRIGPDDAAWWRRLAAAGFNTICWLGRPAGADPQRYLDAAQAHGLMVWDIVQGIDVSPYPVGHPIWAQAERAGGRSGRETALPLAEELDRAALQFEARRAGLEPSVRVYRNHPAFLLHMPGHEPNIVSPEARRLVAERHAQSLAEWDPYHPRLTVFAGGFIPPGEAWTRWSEILSFDIYTYPGWDRPESRPGIMARYTQRLKRRADAVGQVAFVIPMAEALNPARSPRGLRPDEQRCQTFLAVMHGAKGLLYFTLDSLYSKAAWETLGRLGRDLRVLGPALVAPAPETSIAYGPPEAGPVSPADPPVQAALFRHPDGRLLLLAANTLDRPVSATVAIEDAPAPGAGPAVAEPVRDALGPAVWPLNNGAFSDVFEPYATRAYVLPRAPAAAGGAAAPGAIRIRAGEPGGRRAPADVPFEAVIAAVRKGRNTVANPSFEVHGANGVPDFARPQMYDCEALAGEPGASWSVDRDRPYHGGVCLRLESPPAADLAGAGGRRRRSKTAMTGMCYLPPLDRPAPYVFSLFLRGGRAGDQAEVEVGGLTPSTQTFTLTPEWQRYAMPGRADANGDTVYTITAGPGAVVWVDALQMEAGTAPTEFVDAGAPRPEQEPR